MKRFYKSIRVDLEALRFYATCETCGKKIYGAKIPVLCRSARTLARCEKGKAGRWCQSAFNHTKANTTRLLALQFNQCLLCRRWVCDSCFDSHCAEGACRTCSHHTEINEKGGCPND